MLPRKVEAELDHRIRRRRNGWSGSKSPSCRAKVSSSVRLILMSANRTDIGEPSASSIRAKRVKTAGHAGADGGLGEVHRGDVALPEIGEGRGKLRAQGGGEVAAGGCRGIGRAAPAGAVTSPPTTERHPNSLHAVEIAEWLSGRIGHVPIAAGSVCPGCRRRSGLRSLRAPRSTPRRTGCRPRQVSCRTIGDSRCDRRGRELLNGSSFHDSGCSSSSSPCESLFPARLDSLLPVKSSTKRRRFFGQPTFDSGYAGSGGCMQ